MHLAEPSACVGKVDLFQLDPIDIRSKIFHNYGKPIQNRFGLQSVLLTFGLVFAAFFLNGCQTTEIENVVGDPSLRQLAKLPVVEETDAGGELKIKRFMADPQGRFAIAISPLDGSDRPQAFEIAEQAFGRICGQSPVRNDGAGEPGVGRLGSRAPYYSSEMRSYYIYMQCAGSAAGG